MIHFTKSLAVIGVAGAMALAAATPSEARSGRNAAAIGAGVAGFAIGAAVGSAAASANSGYYYGQPAYGYGYSQPAYGYYSEPAYVDSYAYAPRRSYYGGDPSGYYAPAYGYSRSYRHGPAREDHLTGTGAGFID
ncbi:MAG: hypothetical protein ABWY66_04140 [Xanthobacteraceae bacterium]